jgi:diguanylate cyclase
MRSWTLPDTTDADRRWLMSSDGRHRRAVSAAVAISALLLIIYVASFAFAPRGASGYSTVWDFWVGHLCDTAPGVLVVLSLLWRRRQRLGWGFIAAGIVLNLMGNVVYQLWDQNLTPIPNPALSDVPYLLSYGCFALGLGLLPFRSVKSQRSLLLDGLIAGLSSAAVLAASVFEPVLAVAGSPLQIVVAMAYPLMDLVFFALIVTGLTPQRYRPTWSYVLLFAGGLAMALGDTFYLTQVANDSYRPGTVLEALWTLGIFLFGLAAWAPCEHRRPRRESRNLSVVPVFFGLCALGVLAFAPFHTMPAAASMLAVSALALLVFRTLRTIRQLRLAGDNHRQARTDDLTGLPNRRAFFERLDAALKESDAQPFSVLTIDLDGFKHVNDTLGHQTGDDLLRHVADRFARVMPTDDLLARLGGDEFGGYLSNTTPDRAEEVARVLLSVLAQPFALDGLTLKVAASIGMASFPVDGRDRSALVRFSDLAMYHAKQNRLGISRYVASQNPATRQSLQLLEDLRVAVAKDRLSTYFQPIFNLTTGQIERVEALARWEHPTLGLLMPDVFIPLAERSDLIFDLTRSILRTSVSQVAAYRTLRGIDLGLGVNISGRDLGDDTLPDFVVSTCETLGLPLSALTLEITETALAVNPLAAAAAVRRLRDLDVRVSIDDFGVGYSSMSQLLDLAVDELKLDRGFVMPMMRDPRAAAIVTLTIQLSAALGLTLVAEGVESEEILQALVAGGCHCAQGYHVARPAPLKQITELIERGPIRPESTVLSGPTPG